jgi:hypothetical protein
MLSNNIDTIATHDKRILDLRDFNRIDPVSSLPLKLHKGQELDITVF